MSTSSHILALDPQGQIGAALRGHDLGPSLHLHLAARFEDLERLRSALHPDVVVAVLDDAGRALLTQLRDHDADCFRIALVATGSELAAAAHAVNNGLIDGFLPAPWNSQQFAALCAQGCEAALLRRHNRALLDELAQRNQELLEFTERLEAMVDERTRHVREANALLQAQSEELVRLETQTAISQLARGLAHELNNPLAVIIGYTQRLQRIHAEVPDSARRLTAILTEAERCRNLIEQLRNLAMPLDETPLPSAPRELLLAACQRSGDDLRSRLRCVFDGDLPLVLAAPRSLTRVFQAVMDNAADAGAQLLRMRGEIRDTRVLLTLANDGETPDEQAAIHATRPFFTSRADAGHRGLGLAVAAALLREQHGSIALQAGADGGAVVTITLPAAPPATAPMLPVITAGVGDLVLIVDDEPLITELLLDVLRDLRLCGVVATTLAEARAQLKRAVPRALLCAAWLPDGDGRAFLKTLIRRQPHWRARLALISSNTSDGEGELPVLAKPFHLDHVLRTVRAITGLPAA